VHDAEGQQRARRILQDAVAATAPRHDWTRAEISAIFYLPLMELAFQAVSVFCGRGFTV
jgi:biotin synthase